MFTKNLPSFLLKCIIANSNIVYNKLEIKENTWGRTNFIIIKNFINMKGKIFPLEK